MRLILRALTLFLLVLPAAPALSGVVVRSEDGSVSSFASGKVKTLPPEGETVVVFDLNDETLTLISLPQKTYTRATVQEYCRVSETMREEAMAQLPPLQRQIMEELLRDGEGERRSPVVEVESLGDGGTIAGYPTEKFRVLVDGEPYEEVHLAREMPVSREVDTDRLWTLGEEFSACMGSGLNLGGTTIPEEDPAYLRLMRQGFPMKTVDYETGTPEVWSLVVGVEEKPLADAEFLPPAGFREIDLRDFFKSQGGEGSP